MDRHRHAGPPSENDRDGTTFHSSLLSQADFSAKYMLEEIEELRQAALAEIEAAADLQVLQQLRVRHLGRKSRLRQIMSAIGTLPPAQRPPLGRASAEAREVLQTALEQRQLSIVEAEETGPEMDLTLPGRRLLAGKLHLLTWMTEELIEIFQGMGFGVAEGPEIEDEYHNFDALNTPADHPARDLNDTFYLEDGRLLRTHTSPVQVRVMETAQPPVRVVSPGRCYRKETVDATHHYVFHHFEGLYVDRKVSVADLKGTLEVMGRQLMGKETQVRFRPHFFPFTEPSMEYDLSCSICRGSHPGCKICKGSGWLEIGGAGMVDPAVFEAVGYDPEIYSGFAFGIGIDRIAMIRHGIDDIRLFLENDLRFIRQFHTS